MEVSNARVVTSDGRSTLTISAPSPPAFDWPTAQSARARCPSTRTPVSGARMGSRAADAGGAAHVSLCQCPNSLCHNCALNRLFWGWQATQVVDLIDFYLPKIRLLIRRSRVRISQNPPLSMQAPVIVAASPQQSHGQIARSVRWTKPFCSGTRNANGPVITKGPPGSV